MNTKVVLITGASKGIGREIALEFAKNGYALALNYLKSEEDAKSLIAEVKESGAMAMLCKCDISDHEAVKSMVEKVISEFGRIDVLINNAGITMNRAILKMTSREWNEVVNTDLSGPFYVLKECGLVMAARKSGMIINISSITAFKGVSGAANYAAAKAGLLALTKSAAIEFGRYNVRVNSVLPGFHMTGMGQGSSKTYKEKAVQDSVLGLTTDIKELLSFIVLLTQMKTVSGQFFNWDSRII